MAYAITSEDMIAICLVLADFDPEMGMGEVIRRAEKYQESESGYFGESDRDFRNAFFWVELALGWTGSFSEDPGPQEVSDVPLKEWIIPLLTHYIDVYFNDEGEHWTALHEERERPRVSVLSGSQQRDEELKKVSDQRRHLMREFFSDPANFWIEKISGLLRLLGWRKELLLYYLFPEMIFEDEAIPLCCGCGNTIRWRYAVEDGVTDNDQ